MKQCFGVLLYQPFRTAENLILVLAKIYCFTICDVFLSHKKLRQFLQLIVGLPAILFITSCNQRQSDSSLSDNMMTNLILMPTTNSYIKPSFPSPNADAADKYDPQTIFDSKEIMLQEALELNGLKKSDSALEKVNLVIEANPRFLDAYAVRGRIYTEMKLWDKAQENFETMLKIDNNNSVAKFDLIELKFVQKAYDEARTGFASMEKDPNLGDLASYKVFLCDLFSGREDIAKSELDAFDVYGRNPSYYFGNLAWSAYHHQMEDAKSWLDSAVHIYSTQKIYEYSASLIDLGYLPLPSETK